MKPEIIVPAGYSAHELAIYATWFGWVESINSYAYDLGHGNYFAINL